MVGKRMLVEKLYTLEQILIGRSCFILGRRESMSFDNTYFRYHLPRVIKISKLIFFITFVSFSSPRCNNFLINARS